MSGRAAEMRGVIVGRALALALALWLVAPGAGAAQQDPCSSDDARGKTLDAYMDELASEISRQLNERDTVKEKQTAVAQEDMEPVVAGRASADGLDSGRLDLLRQAFMALDLGGVEDEEEGKLVFNFNPERLDLPDFGQFSPRVIVRDPVLFEPLAKAIGELSDEDARQSRKDELEGGFGDLDDVEARVRWTNASDTPDALVQEVAAAIFDSIDGGRWERMADDLATATKSLAERYEAASGKALDPGETTIGEICDVEAAGEPLRAFVAGIDEGAAALEEMKTALVEVGYFELAELIEGAPRWTADLGYRQRQGAVGPPEEWSASVRFEIGTVSIAGWKRWMAKTGRQARDPQSVADYLEEQGNALAPTFSFTAEGAEVSTFSFPLAEGGETFEVERTRRLTGKATGGIFLDPSRKRRLELLATYDELSDDPVRRDHRVVANLTWVENLTADLARRLGGSEVAVSVVWANKPEFRGEVDQEWGMRAGLKWSFGGTKGKD